MQRGAGKGEAEGLGEEVKTNTGKNLKNINIWGEIADPGKKIKKLRKNPKLF